ncbi:MAG: TIGR01777 family oxidoreductase [Gemmatimonadetes bacterium]|nr:TIGR01777 family oxidoreductase [Gemmatimonadota bacterium]
MKIAVTGSTGLVGSALVAHLESSGHVVKRIVRRRDSADSDSVYWDPEAGMIEVDKLAGLDAAVHLAGENIAKRRWSKRQKARILKSRVNGTRLLSATVAGLDPKPEVMVCASAMGYYGDRCDEILTEDSGSGELFLSRVVRDWEAATTPAADAGIRVVNLRLGLVVSGAGGAIRQMMLPFKLGLGGRVGSGRQWVSWIAMADLVRLIQHCLTDRSLRGAVNAASPNPVTNRDLAQTLAKVLHRPAIMPLPSFVVRAALGQMGEELLLSSARLSPVKLVASGFEFHSPDLESALRREL